MVFDADTHASGVLGELRKARSNDLSKALGQIRAGEPPLALDVSWVFGIEPGLTDADISRRIRDVLNVWADKGQRNPAQKNAARNATELDALLRQKQPGYPAARWWADYAKKRMDALGDSMAELVEALQSEYGAFRVITPQLLETAMRGSAALRGAGEAERNAIASQAGLVVVAGFDPPKDISATLRSLVDGSGLGSVPQAVFSHLGGLESYTVIDRFSSRPPHSLELADLTKAQTELAKKPDTEVKGVKNLVGSLIAEVNRGGDLLEIAFAHLVLVARTTLADTGLPLSAIRELADRGLDELDARRIVLAIRGAGDGSPRITAESIRALLADGSLRTARRQLDVIAEVVDAGSPDALELAACRTAIETAEREVSELTERGRKALSAGRIDEAGAAYARALSLAADDEILEREGRSLPPSAPQNLQLTVTGGAVRISWQPGLGSDDSTRFTIVRQRMRAPADRRDGDVVAHDLATSSAVDQAPPIAVPLWYGVSADRGGSPSPMVTAAFTALPAVAGVQVTADTTSAVLSWSAPSQVNRVVAALIGPDGSRRALAQATPDGVTLTGLVTGQAYTVEAVAVYRLPDGTDGRSEPVRAEVVPRGNAEPVPALTAEVVVAADGSTATVISWRRDADYRTEIWRFATELAWEPGSRIEHARLVEAGGARVPIVRDQPASMQAREPSPAGLSSYLVVTLLDSDLVLVGARHSTGVCEPVTDLTAVRHGSEAVLSWNWPRQDYVVEASWTLDGQPRTATVRHSEYRAGGGLRIPIGVGDTTVRVATTIGRQASGTSWQSSPVTVVVSGGTARAGYSVRYLRRGFRVTEVEITVLATTTLSGQTVVATVSAGKYPPTRPGANDYRHTLTLAAGEAGTFSVPTGTASKPYWVRCFSGDPGSLVLTDPPSPELKGR